MGLACREALWEREGSQKVQACCLSLGSGVRGQTRRGPSEKVPACALPTNSP